MADKKNEFKFEGTIEEGFEFIDECIASLSNPDISLEESFEKYKQGMSVLEYCNSQVERVEKAAKKIMGSTEKSLDNNDGNGIEEELPFE